MIVDALSDSDTVTSPTAAQGQIRPILDDR